MKQDEIRLASVGRAAMAGVGDEGHVRVAVDAVGQRGAETVLDQALGPFALNPQQVLLGLPGT